MPTHKPWKQVLYIHDPCSNFYQVVYIFIVFCYFVLVPYYTTLLLVFGNWYPGVECTQFPGYSCTCIDLLKYLLMCTVHTTVIFFTSSLEK